MCEEGNVNEEMKTNRVSKIKKEDRWFKNKPSIWRENRCCQPTPASYSKAALPSATTALPFIISFFRWRTGFVGFVSFLDNPVIIQMVKTACLGQTDPLGSTFKDYREHFFYIMNPRKFCGKCLRSAHIHTGTRPALFQELRGESQLKTYVFPHLEDGLQYFQLLSEIIACCLLSPSTFVFSPRLRCRHICSPVLPIALNVPANFNQR